MTFCRKMSRPEMTVGRETAAVRAQSDRRSSGRERSNRRRSAGPGSGRLAALRRAGVGVGLTDDRPPGNGTESGWVRVGWTGDRAAGDGLLGNERPKMTFCRKMSRPEMTVGRETAAVRAQSDRRSSSRGRSHRRRSAGRWIARPRSVQMQ